ncbi:MAG: formimidoylglutamase [Bacteroidetes bacterium]|nr:formimidoylglutamase [Bacteroidota bacterium]
MVVRDVGFRYADLFCTVIFFYLCAMELVKLYTHESINHVTRKRSEERKIGESVLTLSGNWKKDLLTTGAKFVVIGIAEDMGVRANYGRGGAHSAFKPALESFLNQQCNQFLKGETICVLGEVKVDDLMERAMNLNPKKEEDILRLREFVYEVDKRVSEVVRLIVLSGKIPVIIGGGHNNSFGNIKGASLALDKKINVINCDPHLDFRPLEGRHSGNGFSYAYENNFLEKYSVFGMHEQYNTDWALKTFRENPSQLFYNTYESIFVREEKDFKTALHQSIGFVKGGPCGIEIDLDAITNVPSSAKTSSGISPIQARQFIYTSAKELNTIYLHIAEGAPILSHIKADNKTGKLIAYLMTDFIKGISAKGATD